MTNRIVPTTEWSMTVAKTEQRLKKLETVLHDAQRPDGSIDLRKAKSLAGTDFPVSRLIDAARPDRFSPNLTPDQARTAFLELQKAIQAAPRADTNADGSLGYDENWSLSAGGKDQARRLLVTAATTGLPQPGQQPAMQSFDSVEARQGAEKRITELAEFHAETPLGAEALKWAMRRSVVDGMHVADPALLDAITKSETGLLANIPLFGEFVPQKRGHLSDAELVARFGDLSAFCGRMSREINDRLLIDYTTQYLTGADLP